MQAVGVAKVFGRKIYTYRKWCAYCRSYFMAQGSKPVCHRVTCGKPDCKEAHNLLISNEWRAKHAKTKVCWFCKKPFKTMGKKRKTCGKPLCQEKRNLVYVKQARRRLDYKLRLLHYQNRHRAKLLMLKELERLAGI